ncbi:hypothetical protein U8607_11530 [Methylobacterium durans]|uniref:hypothetical protein n=1 Tax=Methylobacterium durans TaxID=2202825 RepID=UPI002AFF3935|nr:hypothetical protein [Methylobacterium durans]MEA1832713.1 hypothetical protein [Methylobacterium durans]
MREDRWRGVAIAGIGLGALAAGPAPAQPAGAGEAIVCESLVELRLLMAGAPGDRAAAASHLAERTGCRRVSRAAIGAVERRAMVGGAPFECLAVREAAGCLWLLP